MSIRVLRPTANAKRAGVSRPRRSSSAGAVAGTSEPTQRELEVLQGVANGLTSKEIASHLRIHPRTANNHLQRLFMRIQARSRAHAVAIGIRRQLIK